MRSRTRSRSISRAARASSRFPTGIRPARRRCATGCLRWLRPCPTPRACSARGAGSIRCRHLIGAASAWGGNPEKDALYLNVVPGKNDGKTVYRLDVKDVPVDGFWSISVYNAKGYFEPNPQNAYTLNNLTAKTGADGSIAIQFGGCDGKNRELPADAAGLELPRAPLSAAAGNPRRVMDLPGAAAVK